jgi:FkbM family methyltransferase
MASLKIFSYFDYLLKATYFIIFSKDVLAKKLLLLLKFYTLCIIRALVEITHLQIFANYLMLLNYKLMFNESISCEKEIYYINDYLSLLILSPLYERKVFLHLNKEIMKLLRLKNKIVMIDIGAHVGKYTIHFAKLFKSLKIIAIEPIPTNFIILWKNIKINNIENVIPLKFACIDIDKEIQFHISLKSYAHSLAKRETSISLMVKGRSLDSIVNEMQLESIDILKIDVEGAEPMVLRGGLNTIKKYKPIIFIEISPSNYNLVARILKECNYNLTLIEDYNYIAQYSKLPHS